MAKGHKTGGRKKGSVNKATAQGTEYVARVLGKLKAEHKLSAEDVSVALLTCGIPQVIQKELQVLREYLYGKPKESIEHSGQVATVIWDVPRPDRERT